ncbi:MAG: TonB-dependent receptor [Myxococcales bacterium]|nr:TonB-dependent receptor [Myxococcales bacterium]
MRARAVTFTLLLVCCSIARADRAGEARAHYENATSHFAVGEFAEAAVEYQAAFKLKADPALLYNAAQSYRLANNPERALILYRNYLQLYPTEGNAEDVRRQISKLKEAIAASEKAKSSPPTDATEPKQLPLVAPPVLAATPISAAQGGTSRVGSTAVAEKKKPDVPVYKKWWLWTIVGIAVAGGAATAAVLSTRASSSWSNAPDVGPGSRNALVQW